MSCCFGPGGTRPGWVIVRLWYLFAMHGDARAGVGGLRAMRDLLLVAVLLACVLVELLWPQVTSVRADTRDSDELMLEALDGGSIHGTSGPSLGDFFGIRPTAGDALEDGSSLNALAGLATYARSHAFSGFDPAPRAKSQRTDDSLAAQPSSPVPNRQGRLDRRADSATSTIHH